MSTLKTSNIQDTSGGNNSTPEEINQGRAKAWVCSTSAGSVLDSYGIASVTEVGNGNEDFTIAFTTAFSDSNYTAVSNCNTTDGLGGQSFVDTKAAGSCRVNVRATNGTSNTNTGFACVFFGD